MLHLRRVVNVPPRNLRFQGRSKALLIWFTFRRSFEFNHHGTADALHQPVTTGRGFG